MKKVVVATTNFGLGPVGKLSSIVNAGKNRFEWYACGQEFDMNIFDKDVFKDKCWSMEKQEIQNFVKKNNIDIALVVLKNKMARLLKEIGLKVVYVDSLPFMWTKEDSKHGKVPMDMDAYCAQRTLELDKKSKEIFKNVKNLHWVAPIVPYDEYIENEYKTGKEEEYILVNLGGLHSPVGNGEEYINAVVKPLIRILYNIGECIYITCSTEAQNNIKEMFKNDKNVFVMTLKQKEFLKKVKNASMFFTSPGLTTIVETQILMKKTIILPPQNLSQFYNLEYAKKILKYYKAIDWNDTELSLKYLSKVNKVESEIVMEIYNRIKTISEENDFTEKILKCINEEYRENRNYKKLNNGTLEVLEILQEV